MALKFYKGESISLLFNSGDADLSGYNKKIRLFTPLSDILEKDVTPVSANSFSVTISPEETAAFKEGGFNIVLVLTSIADANVVRIGKSVPAVFLDPYKVNPDCDEEANNNLSLSISLGTEVTGINIDGGNFIVLVDGASVEPYIQEAVNASNEAQASATAAAESEGNAAASSTAAETAKTAAQTAKAGAETAKTASETAKTAAETAKTASETAATNAGNSATAAATSANKITGLFETWSSSMVGKVYPFCCVYNSVVYRVISGQTTSATDTPSSTSAIWETLGYEKDVSGGVASYESVQEILNNEINWKKYGSDLEYTVNYPMTPSGLSYLLGWSSVLIPVKAGDVIGYGVYGSLTGHVPLAVQLNSDQEYVSTLADFSEISTDHDGIISEGSVTATTDGYIAINNRTYNNKTDWYVSFSRIYFTPNNIIYDKKVPSDAINITYTSNYILGLTGTTVTPATGWSYSEFIPVVAGKVINYT